MSKDILQHKVTDLRVTLKRINDHYRFEAKGKTGVPVLIDNIGEEDAQGASPMELLLMGVGGCSAIDIIYILKKQRQHISDYKVIVTGTRHEVKEAKPFNNIQVAVHLEGDIDPKKAKKAAQLSFDKYCSVSITFQDSVSITYAVLVNGKKVD